MAKFRVGQFVRVQVHTCVWYGTVAKVYRDTVTIRAKAGGLVRGVRIVDLLAWDREMAT